MYRCTSFVSWEVEGLSVEEGKASKCYCGHRLCVPWPLQKVNWSRGCLGRGIRSDTVLRICWKSASRGLMLALLPKLDSNSHGRLFAKPFIHVTLFHPHSNLTGRNVISPFYRCENKLREVKWGPRISKFSSWHFYSGLSESKT